MGLASGGLYCIHPRACPEPFHWTSFLPAAWKVLLACWEDSAKNGVLEPRRRRPPKRLPNVAGEDDTVQEFQVSHVINAPQWILNYVGQAKWYCRRSPDLQDGPTQQPGLVAWRRQIYTEAIHPNTILARM
jgi:hypothetical protein